MSNKPVTVTPKHTSFWKRVGHSITHNVPLLLSFFIPVVVMLLVFLIRGIYPFGDRCFLRTDLYHQYAPFFQEMRDKLQTGGSLFYSWDIGNGSNFLALFAYYLSSPTNWLLFFCPAGAVIEFITYSIVFKLGLSGFTMGYYLKKHTGRNDYAIPMFASFYALSGYMAAYSWNIMWLDCILAFPLLILGMEKMIKEDKCMLYCLTLAFCIITNYYIAIMISIAAVLFFIVKLATADHKYTEVLIDTETGKPFTRTHYMNYPKKIAEFGGYSLLAGGLSAVLLVPAYYALQISASANSTFPKTFTSYFSILEMLQRHLDNVEVHLGLDHWPNIFCGVAILIFIPLYIMNKRVSWKEKAGNAFLAIFFLASFSMNVLNYIWHGFHYPNSLPCRQSFIYIFLLLVMGYKGFQGLRSRSGSQITGSIVGAIAFVVFCENAFAPDDKWNFPVYYVSILFLLAYGILIYLYRRHKRGMIAMAIIGILMVVGENFMNTSMTSVTTVSRTDYTKYDNDYASLYAAAVKETKEKTDDIFFRCEKFKLRTKNDGSWYQYPSISVFSSTANARMSDYYKMLGMEAATNAYSKTGSTYLTDMLFNIKYEFSNITYPDNEVRKLIASHGDVKMYENKYVLPLGFMVPGDFAQTWYSDSSNPADTLNNFFYAACSESNLLSYVSLQDSNPADNVASVVVKEDGYYYAYLLNSAIDEATTLITSGDGSRTDQSVNHTSLKRRFILDMGYAKAGDTITITSTTADQNLIYSLYRLDPDRVKSAYTKLSAQGLKLTSMSDTVVEGTVNATSDGLLYTSIAYETGWSVTIDGKPAAAISLKDCMMAIPLTAGEHTIRLTYQPQGYNLGGGISLMAIALLILVTWLRYLCRTHLHIQSAFVEDESMTPEEAQAYMEAHPGAVGNATFHGDDEEDEEDESTEEEPTAPITLSEEELKIVDQMEKETAVEKASRKKNKKANKNDAPADPAVENDFVPETESTNQEPNEASTEEPAEPQE